LVDELTKTPKEQELADEDYNFRLYYLTLQEIFKKTPTIAALFSQVTGLPEKSFYQFFDSTTRGGYQGLWSRRLMENLQPKLMKHRDEFTNYDYPILPNGQPDESVFDEHGWKYAKRKFHWYK
jgi:hypothetical protein